MAIQSFYFPQFRASLSETAVSGGEPAQVLGDLGRTLNAVCDLPNLLGGMLPRITRI
jgi:hypothetical protein